ncbi:phosphonate ABC transporter ATP-binding protein [Sporolactobacillus shoreae]|uniref:Phosphonate ABC transporter ATP-binding protein n=1 Tax=Sporolactobacillus shoreae TaxID=1465501 RepID=A0A4Z0GIK2_9BACL|nr:phosphonate ABC transporter ATP-binding protein [Sporolactobacillus shoreae]TGA96037.1 phosphonate ABC transporter ATP-binding protein [Sporolactobacillus shoreae]
MATLLEFRDVSKRYGNDTLALSHVSFSVNEGELVSIIGPSGAGKSTLLRCINRLIEATSGEVIFDKTNVQQLSKGKLRALRTKIGMIFQSYNLVDRLSVFENVLHGRLGYKPAFVGALGLYHESEKKQALEILKSLGLEDQVYKRCDQLSGGQKQRVGIARALVQEPRMLLADEPIASLDPSSSKTIMDHLRHISTSLGITVLVNLHQLDIALNYADRIIGVSQGKVVFDGLPSELTDETIRTIYGADSEELNLNIPESKEVARKI